MKRINLENECFDEMKVQLNASIEHVVQKIASKEFNQGNISLKLTIGFEWDYKEEKEYKKPVLIYKVNTNMQKKSSLDGSYAFFNKELVLDDEDIPVLREVASNQVDMFEEE